MKQPGESARKSLNGRSPDRESLFSSRESLSRQGGICLAGLFLAVISLGFTSFIRAEDEIEVWPVARLNAAKDRWSDWIDQPRKVEGRVSAVSKFQFRLVHCDLTFHVTEEQSRMAANARNVEAAGRFKKDKATGKLLFVVERLKSLPSDADQFDLRESRLKPGKPSDWYELAEWAEARGQFYHDDDLPLRARRAWVKGVQLERTGLPPDDPQARFALVERMKSLKLDEALQTELLHEGARLKWQLIPDDAAQRDQYFDWLSLVAPAAAQPLKDLSKELERRYELNPLKTFHDADAAGRLILWRLLGIQVEIARIGLVGRVKDEDAARVVDELRARVPERADLIEKYREAAFAWRLASVAMAPRAEALRLAEELRSRKQDQEARDLLRGWLQTRESKLRRDDPVILMQLADDYLQLANDEPQAVKLLAEAHRLDPSFEDAGERLKQLGYHFEDDRWVKGPAALGKAPSVAPAGQLTAGMTADQVLTLLGAPTSQSRIISRHGTHEVWSFGRRGTSRLVIYFEHTAAAPVPRVTRYLTEN